MRGAWPWLRVLGGAGVLAVLLWRLGTEALLDGVRAIDGAAVLIALAIGLLTTVLSAGRWCVVARRLGLPLPLSAAVADYYHAQFLNTALPGGVLGDVHRAVRHGRHSGDLGRGVRAVVLERTAGQVALVAVAVPVLLSAPSLTRFRGTVLISAVAIAVLCVAVGVLARYCSRGSGESRWRRMLDTVLADVRIGLLSGKAWAAVLVLSALAVAGHLGLFLVAARYAGAQAPVPQLLPLVLLALLAMGLPVNIGGWGAREGVAALAFGVAGLGAAQGFTTAVVYGVLTVVAALPGVVVLLLRRRNGSQVELEKRVLPEGEVAGRRA